MKDRLNLVPCVNVCGDLLIKPFVIYSSELSSFLRVIIFLMVSCRLQQGQTETNWLALTILCVLTNCSLVR